MRQNRNRYNRNYFSDSQAKRCNKILISDTDSFATDLWHKRYMGFTSNQVAKLSEGRKYDLYFLTDDDTPFVQDGTRDGEHIRYNMNKRFEAELKKQNKPYIMLSGSYESRLEKAVTACNEVLNRIDPL